MAITKAEWAQINQLIACHDRMFDTMCNVELPDEIATLIYDELFDKNWRCYRPILKSLSAIADKIFRLEGFLERPDSNAPDYLDNPELMLGFSGARIREAFEMFTHKLETFPAVFPLILTGVRQSAGGFFDSLPVWLREYHEAGEALQTPLINVLPNVGRSVEALARPFLRPPEGVFRELSEQLAANLEQASGFRKGRERPIIVPTKSGLSPIQLANAYLQGTPLLEVMAIEVPINL